MSAVLGLDEAELLLVKHLGDTPRARHSRVVAAVMAGLAALTGADPALWRAVGLLHDIDYPTTKATPERHGPMAAEWLAAALPADALLAIAAHDHRAGVRSETPIADGLKLADAIAVLDERAGRHPTLHVLRAGVDSLPQLAGERPWLAEMILVHVARLQVKPAAVAALLEGLPQQGQRDTMTS